MAIKFTERTPKDEPEPQKAIPPEPTPEPLAEAVQTDPPGGMPEGQLPFAKTEPKPRGRKKPLK